MRAVWRYSFALLMALLAVALSAAFGSLIAPMRLIFLWAAVLISALVGGLGPAIMTIVIALFAAAYLTFEPIGSFAVESPRDMFRLVLFAIFAFGISWGVGLRRRAERRAEALARRLRREEQRYRTLIEASPLPQAVWTATPEGKLHWSDQWLLITGQSREVVDGGDGLDVVHPEDAPRAEQRWLEALAEGSVFDDELRVKTADGRYRWFTLRAAPVRDEDDAIVEWVGIIADIDEQKRHEQSIAFINRASEVLSSSLSCEETLHNLARLCVPEICDWCVIDILQENDGYERIAVQHRDPALVDFVARSREARPSRERDPILRVIHSGEPSLVEEVTPEVLDAILESDTQREIAPKLALRSWIIAPMRARGKMLGALTVLYSESGRHYTEDDLPWIVNLASRAAIAIDNAQLYEAAEQASRTKDEFLATLSHELRTPLTSIVGWAHMLQQGMTDEESTKVAVDTILRSARSQGELIDDLLDISRVVAGTLHLDIAPVDLVQLISEVLVAARPAADAKGLSIAWTDHPRSLTVNGDVRRLRQVVWNLINNAVKFTAKGSVTIRLEAEDAMAVVTIQDTGRGISPEFLPHVWDRFRQADSSTSRQHGGLGLGLAVVRQLVELHGGTVAVESAGHGSGSTFSFRIPLAHAEEPPGTEEEDAAAP